MIINNERFIIELSRYLKYIWFLIDCSIKFAIIILAIRFTVVFVVRINLLFNPEKEKNRRAVKIIISNGFKLWRGLYSFALFCQKWSKHNLKSGCSDAL